MPVALWVGLVVSDLFACAEEVWALVAGSTTDSSSTVIISMIFPTEYEYNTTVYGCRVVELYQQINHNSDGKLYSCMYYRWSSTTV